MAIEPVDIGRAVCETLLPTMPKEFKLPFGLRDDLLLHVSEVDRGLKCNCVCPGCGKALVARKGSERFHHFAHASGSTCSHAYETALHLAAKQLLQSEGRLVLPAIRRRILSNGSEWEFQKEIEIRFEKVMLEKRQNNLVPDVLIEFRGKRLAIEIKVTHPVPNAKKEKLLSLGIPTVEIDLSDLERAPTMDALRVELIERVERKTWLCNPKIDNRLKRVERLVHKFAERKAIIQRGFALHVDYCPIRARVWRGKPYANVIDDCSSCKYLLAEEQRFEGSEISPDTILCLGKSRISGFDDFLSAERALSPGGLVKLSP